MLKVLILCCLLCGCASKPSNEMEMMTRDVLKKKEGVEIQVLPIPVQSAKK